LLGYAHYHQSANQNSTALFEVTPSHHSNVYIFKLLVSEGRAGEALEPKNKVTLFLPFPPNETKCFTSPTTVRFVCSSAIKHTNRQRVNIIWPGGFI